MSERRKKQHQIILELSRTLSESPESLQLFWESLTRLAADHFQADSISIWKVNHHETGDINHCLCEYNTNQQKHPDINEFDYDFRLSSYPNYINALKKERILAIDDCRHDPRSSELMEQFFIPENTFSMLDATIRTQNQYVGHISIEHNHHIHHWTEDEISFAATLADQASIAILENQRSLLNNTIEQQLKRVKQQQAAIAELSRSQTTISGDIEKTATQACKLVARVLNSQIINVYLRNSNGNYVSDFGLDISLDGRPNPLPATTYNPQDYPIFFQALIMNDPIVIHDNDKDYRSQEFRQEFEVLGTKSELSAAIRIRGEVFGFISCEKTDEIHHWESDEIAFIRNITDIFAAAYLSNELRLAKIEAEQATRQKSIFLANMSHEIRTPMNGILGISEVMLGTELTENQRTYTNNIITSGESLLSLINDILDLSKIETGAMTVENVDFDLLQLIGEVKLLFTLSHNESIQFKVTVDQNLPRFIHSDPYRLRQVLINLLGNSFKFTLEGTIQLECSVANERSEATILFVVRDSGIGFDPEKTDYIFESFTQDNMDSTSAKGGTGLGLNISKNLVDLLGGDIGCQTTQGIGSKFWFTIDAPSVTAPELRPEDKLFPDSNSIPEFDPGKYRLLVAEDNEVNRLVTTTMLDSMGFNFSTVDNGRKAVDALTREPFDAVLMDCQMPIMDGFEAARTIREFNNSRSATKIIALTANAMDGDEIKCRQAGMDNYLSKPFKGSDLLKILRHELKPK